MRSKAQECDQAYWLAKDKASKDNRTTPKPKDTPKCNNSLSSTSNTSNTFNHNKCPNNPSTSNASATPGSSSYSAPHPPSSSPNNSKPNSQPQALNLGNKLGRDGKLTSDEHDRRIKANLYLYCGAAGHNAANCRKSAKAKGRSAHVESASAPAAQTESPPVDSKK